MITFKEWRLKEDQQQPQQQQPADKQQSGLKGNMPWLRKWVDAFRQKKQSPKKQ
jgi:hypothetical protein